MIKFELGFNPYDDKSAQNDVNSASYKNMRAKFLGSFVGNHVFCYNNNPRKKLSGMNHTSHIKELLDNNLKNSSDAYFYVNGSRKKDDINTVRACYIDLDAGRDQNGHYLSPKIVQEKKKQFLKMINDFAVEPTWVLDTRNGYQVYWILCDNDHKIGLTKNKKYWTGIQKKLANYFNADIRAMKINQIFRVPYTWWRKPWEGKKSYFSTLLQGCSGKTVSIVKLQEALTGQSAQVHVKSAKSSDAWYESWRNAADKADKNAVPISVEVATTMLNALINEKLPDVTLSEDDDIPDYIDDTDNVVQSDDQDTNPIFDAKCIPSEHQLKLLSTVVDFLNQAATPLFFSNNKFLSAAAKELAAKISDEFCVG